MRTIMLLITATALATPTLAQAGGTERNGSIEIVRGDYQHAETQLVAERRLFPDHADLTLNLAAVYLHAGRISEARALYRDVLARPNAELDMASGQVGWSHAMAKVALQKLERTQLTAR